jgi:membrane protease YdiL (CAAX protease family)
LWGAALALPILSAAGLFATLVMNGTGLSAPVVLPPAMGAVDLAANALSAGLIAPIGEELLYRGVIAQAWGRQSGARRAIVFSAVVFAFAHTLNIGGESVGDALAVAGVAFAIRLPLGIALGWLWVRRRSLLATIVLHAAYNALLVLATFTA